MARVAIVTGGTRGIGEAISLALKDQGVTVAANYAGNEEKAPRLHRRAPASRPINGTSSDLDACLAGVAAGRGRARPGRCRSSTMPASPATAR